MTALAIRERRAFSYTRVLRRVLSDAEYDAVAVVGGKYLFQLSDAVDV